MGSPFEALSVQLTIPDLWQQAAVRALRDGKDVIVDAPTGAGKTRIFELLVESGTLSGQAIYTVPTRALANDKLAEWRAAGWKVGIATGDLAENLDAPVVVATLETQKERLLSGCGPALLVIDEYQMIGQARRGLQYELAVSLAPPETRLLLLSGSVANPEDIQAWLRRLDRPCELVQVKERPVPLDEMPLEAIPLSPPKSVRGFWPRLAAPVLMADLGPLLIFAPQRNSAEKIARSIAGCLDEWDPPKLTSQQTAACGKDLTRLLQKRVAFHHSGLSYAARAGVVEPLARAGQLHVIVATMGLAAGINFSMRSVFVSESRYFDGTMDKTIGADELLQMFGRAGRRGLDEIGYIVTTAKSPRPMDAAPLRLLRTNQVDWPTLLRVMQRAKEEKENGGREKSPDPFAAAQQLCLSLFSKQKIALGLEEPSRVDEGGANRNKKVATSVLPSHEQSQPVFGLGATRELILNSKGAWERRKKNQDVETALVQTLSHHPVKGWLPSLQLASTLEDLGPGRICRIRQGKESEGIGLYGKEVALATVGESGTLTLTKNIRRLLADLTPPLPRTFSRSDLDQQLLTALAPRLEGGIVGEVIQRDNLLSAIVDYAGLKVIAHEDDHGALLLNAPSRSVKTGGESEIDHLGQPLEPPAGSAVHAWRKLGLIDREGGPTRRGQIISFFQQAEGFPIVAALEDATYPLEELVLHIANLRGDRRFDSSGGGGSERLSHRCRQVFGVVDYPGYLHMGLPEGYSQGTAEVIEAALENGVRSSLPADGGEAASPGDIERALVEWLSLLRHLVNAPECDWDRWRQFKEAAARELEKHGSLSPSRNLKAVTMAASELQKKVRHQLPRRAFS